MEPSSLDQNDQKQVKPKIILLDGIPPTSYTAAKGSVKALLDGNPPNLQLYNLTYI